MIGNTFNRRCEKILLAAGEVAGFKSGKKIKVCEISKLLDLDRTEVRNTFLYLIDLELIRVESIGGPLLYGHISITKKGLLKLKSIKSR